MIGSQVAIVAALRKSTQSVVTRSFAVGCCLTLVLTGCTFSIGESPESVAEELIEGELADQRGITGVIASYEAPPNRDDGTTFTCTAQSDRGDDHWTATIKDDDTVNVQSEDVLDDEDISSLEVSAVEALEAQSGGTLGVENFDRGVQPLVVGSDNNVVCALTNPADGAVYDATITITDFDTGTFDVNVAEQPRP